MATTHDIAIKREDAGEEGNAPVVAVENLHKAFGNLTV